MIVRDNFKKYPIYRNRIIGCVYDMNVDQHDVFFPFAIRRRRSFIFTQEISHFGYTMYFYIFIISRNWIFILTKSAFVIRRVWKSPEICQNLLECTFVCVSRLHYVRYVFIYLIRNHSFLISFAKYRILYVMIVYVLRVSVVGQSL